MKLRRPIFLLLLLFLLRGMERPAAAAGELDPAFSLDGKVRLSFGDGSGGPQDMAIDGNGRTLVVGTASSGDDRSFAVARYLADGSLDPSFGDSGVAIVNVGIKQVTISGSGDEEGRAVAVQPDGKIVLAGSVAYTTNADFAVVRLNADGSLDSSFGAGGIATADLLGSDYATDVAIQPDGKIVAAGISGGNFAVARFDADGRSLDASFNGGYKVMSGIIDDEVPDYPAVRWQNSRGRLTDLGQLPGVLHCAANPERIL